MEKKKEKDLQKIEWLLEKEDNQKKKDQQPYIPSYGDVTELNTERTILDLVGKDTLEALCVDTMDLLDTSVAVYEKNGDYAFGMFVSGWCQLMDAASRKLCNTEDNQKALASGKWHCHENCWNESAKVAIKTGKPTDIACIGGINLYAEPIYSGNQIIGVINIGYGNPPTDEKTLKELSQKYQINYHTLLSRAKEYKPRPPFIIDIAKKRLHNIAFLVGKIVQNARNEKKIKESEEEFKIITEGSADAIFITDQKGNYIYANQAASKLLGYSREEITHMNIRDLSLPEEVKANLQDFKRLLQGKRLFKEYTLVKKDGSPVPVDLNAILLPNGFVYGSCRDISQRKEAEEKIKQLNSLLKSIRNVNQLIVQEHDFKKVIQGSCQILQQNRDYLNIEIALLDEQTGKISPVAQEGIRKLKHWAATVDNPADAPRCIREVIQSHKPNMIIQASREYCGSCPYYMADVDVRYKNIFVPMMLKGRLIGIITTTMGAEYKMTTEEIELLKEAAGDLAFARNSFLDEEKKLSDYYLLQIAGKTAKFGGWSVDTATRTYLWSDTVADIHEMPHGYAPHVKEGIKFYAPEWQERITKVFSDCAHQGNPYNEEMEIITGKGKRKWVRTTGIAVKNKKGEIIKVVGSFQDITQHKHNENRIKHLNQVLLAIRDVNQLIIKEKNRNKLIQKACKILIGTRGYYGVWIVLLDKNKKFLTFAEAGYGNEITPLIDKLKHGEYPKQIRRVLKGKRMVVIENPEKVGKDCPLSDYHNNRSTYNTVLCQDSSVYGMITVCIPKEYAHDKEEQSLFKEVAGDLSFALSSIEVEEKRKQAVKLLRESEERYRTLFETMAEGCQVIGYDLRYLYINDAAAKHGKKPKDRLIGKTMMEVYPGIEDTEMFSVLKHCIKNRKIQRIDNQFNYSDGTSRWFQLIMQPIPEGVLVLSQDITDRM